MVGVARFVPKCEQCGGRDTWQARGWYVVLPAEASGAKQFFCSARCLAAWACEREVQLSPLAPEKQAEGEST